MTNDERGKPRSSPPLAIPGGMVKLPGGVPRDLRCCLGFALGFPEACDAVPWFPLAAFLEQFYPLKALEDVPFAAQKGRRAQTTML